MKTEPIKILICSEHLLYRQYLALILQKHSNRVEVTAIVDVYEKAFLILRNQKIDFMLIELDQGIKKPFEFVKNFCTNHPKTRLVALTFWDQHFYNIKLVEYGAFGYYLINSKIEKLVDMLESTA